MTAAVYRIESAGPAATGHEYLEKQVDIVREFGLKIGYCLPKDYICRASFRERSQTRHAPVASEPCGEREDRCSFRQRLSRLSGEISTPLMISAMTGCETAGCSWLTPGRYIQIGAFLKLFYDPAPIFQHGGR